MNPVAIAFFSAALFSISSVGFTYLIKQTSSLWMNLVKAQIAIIGFFLCTHFVYGWHEISMQSLSSLLISGAFGLGFADICLFLSFKSIGPARTLMLFGFAPLMNGTMSYYFFDQQISAIKFLAIFFMILCLFTFSLESYKKNGQWEVRGLMYALLGVFLDSIGVCLSRYGFNQSPDLTPIEANFYRTLGALAILWFLALHLKSQPWKTWRQLDFSSKRMSVLFSFTGTFLSLWLFLTAVRTGHLASVSGVAVTAPFIASVCDCVYARRLPSKYLFIAGFFFLCGSWILLDL